MRQMLTAIFDGEVLRPDTPVGLTANVRYRVTVEPELGEGGGINAWDVLDALSGTVEGPEDWAAEHDHYLYGTPKRGDGSGA